MFSQFYRQLFADPLLAYFSLGRKKEEKQFHSFLPGQLCRKRQTTIWQLSFMAHAMFKTQKKKKNITEIPLDCNLLKYLPIVFYYYGRKVNILRRYA